MPVQLLKAEPHIVTYDDEPIRLHFKRMTVLEFEAFNAVFSTFNDGRDDARQAPAAGALNGPEWRQRTADDAALARAHADWITEVFDAYVRVEPGDLLDEDGNAITAGRRFLEVMVGQTAIIIDVLAGLWMEHRLTLKQKKTLRSLPVFGPGSNPAPASATAGERPVPVATPVEVDSSADPAAAMAERSAVSSGTTVPSACSELAPSDI